MIAEYELEKAKKASIQQEKMEIIRKQQAKQTAKIADRSKAIFVVRTLEPARGTQTLSHQRKQVSKEYYMQSQTLELPRCHTLDQQHREFEEYKKKEKKRIKKKEYV